MAAGQTQGEGDSEMMAGEAGFGGSDRQPVEKPESLIEATAPDEKEAATPTEVKARSEEAAVLQHLAAQRKDIMHPGPDREELEKGDGAASYEREKVERHREAEQL